MQRLINPAEAAAFLDISVKKLRALVGAGQIEYRLVGSRRKFTEADLSDYLEKARVTSWQAQNSSATKSDVAKSVASGRRISMFLGSKIGLDEVARRVIKQRQK